MYPEFIAIYVGLVILFIMLIINMILLIVLLKRLGKARSNGYGINNTSNGVGNVVFCKKCAAQFNASLRICPECGTPK